MDKKEYMKNYLKQYAKTPKRKEYMRKYIKRFYDKKRESPEWVEQRKTELSKRQARYKINVLNIYGWKCAFCGEKQYEYLCIDHINDDGNSHRKSGSKISWSWFASHEYDPTKYQILCCNCNSAKQYYKIYPGGKELKTDLEWIEFSK